MTLPPDHVAHGDCVEVMKDILGHPSLPPRALCKQGDPPRTGIYRSPSIGAAYLGYAKRLTVGEWKTLVSLCLEVVGVRSVRRSRGPTEA
jgi:hypothetical protein